MTIGQQDSHLEYDAEGNLRVAVGKDAVAVYAAATLASALRLYARTGMKANRAYGPKVMLKAATRLTGKPYKHGQYLEAAEDVSVWVIAMKAALPQVVRP